MTEQARKSQTNEATIEKLQGIIAGMSNETFLTFSRELQYALRWSDSGIGELTGRYGDDYFYKTTKKRQKDPFFTFKILGQRVLESPLYVAIRTEIKKRLSKSLPVNWTGWIGLQSEEGKQIANAAKTKALDYLVKINFWEDYQPDAKWFDQVKEANNILDRYKIRGLFVKDPQEDLLTTFYKHYAPNPET